MNQSKHRNITRVDYEKRNEHGWSVRVTYAGRSLSRFLADAKYGGRQSALDEALRERERMEKELGRPHTDRRVVGLHPRNTSGVVGIGRDGKSWRVHWQDEVGRKRTRFFPFGEDEQAALKRAAGFRRRKERELYGTALLVNWEKAIATIAA